MTDQDKAFYADGYRHGNHIAENGIDSKSLYEGVLPHYEEINELIAILIDYGKQNNIHVDCKAGCSYCCNQSVYGMEHEFDTLATFLTTHWTLEEREALIERAKARYAQTQNLSKEELALHKSPCPFLKNNKCSVYEVRPMACRIYLSTSVSSCRHEYETPSAPDAYPQLLDFPLRAGRLMNEGMVAALKVGGYKSREYRIEEGILAFRFSLLDEPDVAPGN
ncbi:MAG: YkgJ family cysteine cluster protein [Bacteroidales bacterium]